MKVGIRGGIHTKAEFQAWLRSPSSRTALCVSAIMYVAYGYAHGAWDNYILLGLSLFTAGFLATFANLSNATYDWANNATALITVGRLARFILQLAINLVALGLLYQGGVLLPEGVATVGGVMGAALLTTLASQGAQYFGFFLFQRRIGDLHLNILLGISATIALTAFGTAGVPVAREAFLVAGIAFGAIIFGLGLISDIRAFWHPTGGIGMFLGTFNPFHESHLRLIREAIATRGLEKVIVHPTIVPWLHERALQRGEIRVGKIEDGYIVYETTEKADVNADYFPTGNRFLPPETRRYLIELAIEEAGLSDRVEVAFHPEIYGKQGFFGVIERIKRNNSGKTLHGIHGSDVGGMHARLIMDECGWIYPVPFLRRDRVSATAIRGGAMEMTSAPVASALKQISEGAQEVVVRVEPAQADHRFINQGGSLVPAH